MALTGKETRFDFYFEPLGKWYSISVFCPQHEYFIAISQEISQRMQALAESELLAKFPAENPNPVQRISGDGVVLYHNPASAPLLKHWVYVDGELLQKFWLRYVQSSLADNQVKSGEVEIGDNVLSLTFAPIVEAGFVNVYGLDITERKRAVEALWEYSERLEDMVAERTRDLEAIQEQLIRQERLAVLGEMTGGVGHELRNPLGVITNAIYYLKMILPNADAEIQEYLGMIDMEASNAAKIVSDLLDFARIKSSDRKSMQIRVLVGASLRKNPTPEGISAAMQNPGDLPLVWVDPQQISLVMNNLIVNAYQAMPDGGQLTITCDCDPYADSGGDSHEGAEETKRWVRVASETAVPASHLNPRVSYLSLCSPPSSKVSVWD